MLSAAIDGMLPSADRLQTDALHRAEGAVTKDQFAELAL